MPASNFPPPPPGESKEIGLGGEIVKAPFTVEVKPSESKEIVK